MRQHQQSKGTVDRTVLGFCKLRLVMNVWHVVTIRSQIEEEKIPRNLRLSILHSLWPAARRSSRLSLGVQE